MATLPGILVPNISPGQPAVVIVPPSGLDLHGLRLVGFGINDVLRGVGFETGGYFALGAGVGAEVEGILRFEEQRLVVAGGALGARGVPFRDRVRAREALDQA